MHKFKIEATKFTLVGAANFVLTFTVFTVLLKLLGLNCLLSLIAAWLVGMPFSYILNFIWVFKPEEKIQFKARFIRFILASILSIVLNMLVLNFSVEHAGFDPFYVQLVLIPFIAIFNFSTAKYWSLQKRPSLIAKITGKDGR
jgi:putative flippase GtrA